MSISDNVKYVRERIAENAIKTGRRPEDITLVAVTKSTDIQGARELMSCGVSQLAENRVQMLREKQKEIDGATWHLIGHLQTNKVKDVCGRVSLIQSLDSVHLATEIEKTAAKMGLVQDCLCEVNIFREESKGGIMEEEIDDFLGKMSEFDHLRIRGFMTMAPLDAEEAEIRKGFEKIFKIYVDKQKIMMHNIDISILSMGMSRDFEYAIQEGATHIRVGRRLFT